MSHYNLSDEMLYNHSMRRQNSWIVHVFCLILLCAGWMPAACNRIDSPTPVAPTLAPTLGLDSGSTASPPTSLEAPPSRQPASTISPTSEASPTPFTSDNQGAPAQYILTARFDYAAHTLSVEESVVFTNTTGIPLHDLLFMVEPNRYPGAFHLNSLAWEDGGAVASFTLDGNKLTIPLPQPLQPKQELRISFGYDLFLPPIPPPSDTTRPVPFGYTERQSNLVDWYLYLPPFHPEQGWLAHNPWYYGEHQVYDVADYQVNLQLSAGELALTVAASTLAEQDGEWLHYRMEKARSFALSVGLEYVVFSQKVGEVTVLSYAFPFDREAGKAALRETAAAMELYTELFGPYPHPSLTIMEADFLDGMEYDGMFFLSRGFYNLYDGTPRGYLTAIAVHETAHQWWYGKVGNDQALEPWLDEALCTYSERVFYERVYPELVDWWWAFRVEFFQPSGVVNGQLYDFNGFRPYVNAVYLRGAIFMEELRNTMGDEAFFAFLKDYAARKEHQLATRADFFAIVREHSSADFQRLEAEFFRSQ